MEENLPRVIWCGTGSLAFLPLHAAGIYDGRNTEYKAFNYAVSSYTPTLEAILPRSRQSHASVCGLLAVSEPSSLPGAATEIQNIADRLGTLQYQVTKLDKGESTPEAVLQGMGAHSCVHLACHAHQNSLNPTKSAFQLHGGDLTLTDIIQKEFNHADFAFLSACQTATGDERVPDEAVHLVAGMLFTGYRSVIGTMWSIKDNEAPLVADEVYAQLVDPNTGKLESSRAAYALHRATALLRRKVGETDFQTWVPFVYFSI
jgi:CHAT domain-containing protein